MKNIIILYLLLVFGISFSQEIKFEEVVKVDSTITKDELFNRARSWIAKSYNNEKYVIATEDRANGEISGNGSMNYSPGRMFFGAANAEGDIDYKINIFVKEGRYKFIFHSFRHNGSSGLGNTPISYGLLTTDETAPRPSRGGANNKAWSDIKMQASEKIKKTILSLKESMNKSYEANNNW